MLIIFIPDPFNTFYLLNFRKESMFLTVLNNIDGRVFPNVRNIHKLFEGGCIDIDFVINFVAINKVDNVRKRGIFLE